MNVIDAYLMEFEQESATTRNVLDAVPEAKYSWRPHEKGMSMGELCGHIASIPAGMPEVLGGESFDFTQRPDSDPAPANKAALLAQHDAAVATSKKWLSGLGDRANATWQFKKNGEVLMEMPRATAIRFFMLNHLYHHRGQLSTYLRATGEVVPSVYGPTADVDPFG